MQCMRRAGRGRRLLFVCLAACSAQGTRHRQLVLSAVGSNTQLCRRRACSAWLRRAGFGRRLLFVCLAGCSAQGTVGLYLQLSAPMHSYAGSGLQCMRRAGRGRRLLFEPSYASRCVQLQAPSAATCSRRLQCTATQALGLQCLIAACWTWPPLTFTCLAACSARGTFNLYVQLSARLSAPMHSYAGLGLQCMRRAGRGRRLLFESLYASHHEPVGHIEFLTSDAADRVRVVGDVHREVVECRDHHTSNHRFIGLWAMRCRLLHVLLDRRLRDECA